MRCRCSTLIVPALLILTAVQAHAQHLVINPTFDSSITSDPNSTAIEGTINSAISDYENTFTNPTVVNITFSEMTSGLGQSSTFISDVNYSDYVAALQHNEQGQSFLNFVPSGSTNPVNGSTLVQATLPDLRTLGFTGFNVSSDATISLNTSQMNLSRTGTQNSSKYDLKAVAEHEINEVLGLGSTLDGLKNSDTPPNSSQPIGTLDLFRYSAANTRSFTTSINAQSYFSINGGQTSLVGFNQNANGDFHDWFSTGPHTPEVQDAFGTPGVQLNNGTVEFTALETVGYTIAPAPEPSAFVAMGLGTLLLGGLRLRARRRMAGV